MASKVRVSKKRQESSSSDEEKMVEAKPPKKVIIIEKHKVDENEDDVFENVQQFESWVSARDDYKREQKLFEKTINPITKLIKIHPLCLHGKRMVQDSFVLKCPYASKVGMPLAEGEKPMKPCGLTTSLNFMETFQSLMKNPESALKFDLCKTCKCASMQQFTYGAGKPLSWFPLLVCKCSQRKLYFPMVNAQSVGDVLFDYTTITQYQTNKNKASEKKVVLDNSTDFDVPE